jgi:hypothetical protein
MGAHQVDLQLTNLLARYADVGQLAHSRRDGVRHAIFRDQRIHHGAGAVDGLASARIEQHRPMIVRNLAHRFEGEIVSVNV